MVKDCSCAACNPVNQRNFEYVAPPKLTLKERLHKQRMENIIANDRAYVSTQARIKNGDFKPKLQMPVEIFRTKNPMNDINADDLQNGDLSREKIELLSPCFGYFDAAFEKTSDELFFNFKDRAKGMAFGKYRSIIISLIEHMEGNSGSLYNNDLLTEALQEHATTHKLSNYVAELIKLELQTNGGNLQSEAESRIRSNITANAVLPKFNTKWDYFNGLGLAVHDVYAVSITISSLTINNGSFDGVLSFKVQDHFGLDKADVSTEKPFHTLAFFREWFLLQRYEKFGFKPFITEMNFDTDIKGVY